MIPLGFVGDWNLCLAEAKVLDALMLSGDVPVCAEGLRNLISKGRITVAQNTNVTIYRLRRKLKEHGCEILCIRGKGYMLTAQSISIIQAAIAEKYRTAPAIQSGGRPVSARKSVDDQIKEETSTAGV
jgi:DNA-binding winged helix-turn-helix (wHTH) protein